MHSNLPQLRLNRLSAIILGVMICGGAFASALRSAAVTPQEQPAAAADAPRTCEHTIDPAKCPFCTPSLIESDGFCHGHNVAEALCVKCRPFLAAAFKAKGDWCVEHNTPESQCVLCHPEFAQPKPSPKDVQIQPGETDPSRLAKAALPRINREPDKHCAKTKSPIPLSSPEVARTAGFAFVPVKTQPLLKTVSRNTEIAYDASRYVKLGSRASGVVAEVRAELGDRVSAGDVVAVVESVDLADAKAALLQAQELVNLWQANATRERQLVAERIGSEREAIEAETRLAESRIALNQARQRLRNFGLSNPHIDGVLAQQDTEPRHEIVAPIDGLIVKRAAAIGEVVQTGEPLVEIADTSTMWAMIDLSEADLMLIEPGQPVQVTLEGMPAATFAGRLTWVSSAVDDQTRMLQARAEIDNRDGRLRANMFGKARITLGESSQAMLVPKEAVQWEGCCNVVFVPMNEQRTQFMPKPVQLGIASGGMYEVLAGLTGDELVTTRGSYLLKTEILKSNIGAGCCEVDHLAK